MGYNHYELGIAGGTGVSATMVVIATLICIWEIQHQLRNIKYPAAQYRLTFLLTAPIIIGWLTFGILYNPESERIITSILLGYKAIYLFCFNRYCERLLGWIDTKGKYEYSSEQSLLSLQNLGNVKHAFLCSVFGTIPLKEYEQARSFMLRTRYLVGQLIVILILSGVLTLLLEFATGHDYVSYGNSSFHSAWIYLTIIRSLSTIVATYSVFLYSVALNRVPRLKHLGILAKFGVVKFAILLPELQPLVLDIFASAGAISDDYSKADQVAFVNGLLVCDEMVIVAFIQLLAFDPSEYVINHEEEDRGISTHST